jgi:Domain of unknown function (DUF4267)
VSDLLAVYGVRDIYMGISIHVAAFLGTRSSLGWTLVSAGAVAFLDGLVCWRNGKGQWNHWGYAPMFAGVGAVLLGLFD